MKIEGDVIVVSDVHGEYEKTKKLLGILTNNKILTEDKWVVFLGDYVDIGNKTKETLDLLIGFGKYHKNTVFLAGNHDINLIKALNLVSTNHNDFYHKRIKERNRTTLNSYNAKNGEELYKNMPDSHKNFLMEMEWVVEHPNYVFIHCGFDPFDSYQNQINILNKKDYNIFKPKWMYDNSLGYASYPINKYIISGHMNVREPVYNGNKIVIDTGAGYGGVLTALHLSENKIVNLFQA